MLPLKADTEQDRLFINFIYKKTMLNSYQVAYILQNFQRKHFDNAFLDV